MALAFGLALFGCGTFDPDDPDGLPPRPHEGLRLASHNVHFIRLDQETGPWSLADWEQRKQALDASFKHLDADIVGFQEMVSMVDGPNRRINLARDWLLERNPDYAMTATGDWRVFPTRQPIFYRQDRLSVLDQGWFYFEDETEVARQTRYNEFWIYYCSWAKFRDARGRVFTVYNLHFHYRDPNKRHEAARRLAARVQPQIDAGETVFVLGDTNSLDDWKAVRLLRKAGLEMLDDEGATFHFNAGLGLFGAIDRIGATPQVSVLGGPWVVSQRFGGEFPSDHYPVVADFSLPE